jgi:hypothetical protein
MAFVKRFIDVTIKLPTGTFPGTDSDSVTLSGYRVGAYLAAAGGLATGVLQCQIYGLPLDKLNALTIIGPINTSQRGGIGGGLSIIVAAGDIDASGNKHGSVMFQGKIQNSWADFSCQPDVVLNIVANGSLDAALTPVNASSYRGTANAAEIMKDLAGKGGFGFINHGVSANLDNVYLAGSILDQIKSLAIAAQIQFDINGNTLEIWQGSKTNGADGTLLISPETGLVGYPNFSSEGMWLTAIYQPRISNGAVIEVKSSLQPACGKWVVTRYIHSLEAENPSGGGSWFSSIYCGATKQ